MLTITDNIAIPKTEFEFRFSRSPGPGGQNVNKLNTKVTLKWAVEKSPSISAELKQKLRQKFPNRFSKDNIFSVTSHRYRDQGRNISDCLVKLKKLILLANQPKIVRKPTKPTKGSQKRRLENKKKLAAKKQLRRSVDHD